MKKSNLATFMFFIISIVGTVLFMVFREDPSASLDEEKLGTNIISVEAKEEESVPEVSGEAVTFEESVTSGGSVASREAIDSKGEKTAASEEITSMKTGNSLFIGDSRTVGLWEYGCIEGADFFASEGMSVYNIHKKIVSVPGAGKVTLTELLENKQYAKIYIMLGINELGYNLDNTAVKYEELAAFIREKQPEALLFLQANLHVSKKRSDQDRVINNGMINKINTKIAELADNKEIFYLDANVLFDDGDGNLAADKTEDEAHPYGKYYAGWSDWIMQQTALLTGKG